MDSLTPLLMNFLEEHARPHVQDKVSEELTETKGELKSEMPDMIKEHITGPESHPLVAQIVSSMGDDFMERVRQITDITIETASEGMDLLLTNGVMNIAKGVLTKKNEDEGEGGFNMDFLKSGKEGMIETTMAASTPVIKQVSDNMGRKISAHFPAQIGSSIQEMIDEHGGANGMLGMAAGFMAKFMTKGGDGSSDGPGERTIAAGGTEQDVEVGHPGSIQQLIQKLLAPKIMLLIQPYLQKFEAKMNNSLEGELRNKVFSVDYIKSTVMNMITGLEEGGNGQSGFGNLIGAFLHKKSGSGRGDREDGEERDNDPMAALSALASGFLKSREN
ncbi:hypothetical protein EMPS_11467 [Entomortierella parvispora]|uniref:DUF937 domain-containing protein n=1 Tax=Entomortierella parvispora TaxID=205924 RepID=A0A9P3HMF9_9FUNG|nr:hypothetical protein EMPS_11467 [Entomortierella parvispora]